MKQIDVKQIYEMINMHNLVPCGECYQINQDNGEYKKMRTKEILSNMDSMRKAVIKTDDNGTIRIVTVDIYYNYRDDDLHTGEVVRLLLHRVQPKKRIQPILFSNGVGAPTHNTGYIRHFINN